MKPIAVLLILMLGMSDVNAQSNDCTGDQILDIYVDVRDNEVPMLDGLSTEDKQKISVMYQGIIDAVESQLLPSTNGEAPEPRMRNDLNLVNISTNDTLTGTLAIQTDLILSLLQAEDRENLIDTLKEAVAALNGESSITFGDHQDHMNRGIVENALESYGCPSDLMQDYGISGYTP
ncbi:hypothetical protein [Luteimonas salinilitoris]|uniref:DUF3347 domain-containing protein n=1 Tax=Luteimonas salinilitoris TaxID=3237697 RepID=A0ABV4HMY2_9GAMM